MKFVVSELSKCKPRRGILKEFRNSEPLETPAAMLYTQGGSIPHITREVYEMFSCNVTNILQIPLVTVHNFIDAMREYNKDISHFIGMKDCVTCLTVQDPGNLTHPGHHVKDSIPIWTRSGKILINPESYMNAVETFKPEMYYLLSDGDTNISSSAKRVSKAVDRTLMFIKQSLIRHNTSSVLKDTFVMAPISGGYCLKARERCIMEILRDDEVFGGFLIDGLHNNGPEVEFLEFREVKEIVEFVISKLPQDKLRAIHGCYNPVTILKLVQLGVDLFDTSYCHLLTERSAALTFNFNDSGEDRDYEINLRHEWYAEDFTPILEGCQCLSCKSYTRGYIHHLLTVQELLASVLLSIHNIHHFMEFFATIRKSISNGNLKELENKVSRQFDKHLRKIPNSKSEQITSVVQHNPAE